MREGPSKPLCRERLQTATSCCGTMATVVNVVVKSVDRPRQVWMRETNASEPPIKHRNLLRRRDRKSTRLNSSHANISYAVFCLKKKKKNKKNTKYQNKKIVTAVTLP